MGAVLVHMKTNAAIRGSPRWGLGSRLILPSTLLGPETTGPWFPGPCVGWEACCCPAWWWGVVFDSWIVVASIKLALVLFFPLVGLRGFWCWFVVV